MGFNYNVVKDRKFVKIIRPLGRFYGQRIRFRIEYRGLENVPKEGGFIVASNHIHYVDPAIILMSCPREVHFMGKAEAFNKNPLFAALLTGLNTFPVTRSRTDRSAIEYAEKLIENGLVMGIFPEGTRSKDGTPQAPKAGIALIARETKADILPVSISCKNPKEHRRRIVCTYGKIIPFEQLNLGENSTKQDLRDASNLIMDKIKEMWSEAMSE